MIFAALLEPSNYGHLSYLIGLAGTASVISRFGLNHSIIVSQSKNNKSLSNQINFLALILTSIASVLLLSIDILASVICFSLSFFFMNISNLLGLKKYKLYFKANIIKSILVISLSIVLYFNFELPGIILGFALAHLVMSYDFFRDLKRPKEKFSQIKIKFKTLLHNYGVDLSTSLAIFVDKLVIAPLFGFKIVGLYQLNLQILFALETIPLAIHSFILSEESSGRKHNTLIIWVTMSSIVTAVIVIFLAPFVIPQLFPKYVEGIDSLQVLILSIIPLSINAILNAKLQALESTKIGFSFIIRIGSLLILLAILGSEFGLIGLSLAVLFSAIFNTIFLYVLYNKSKKIKI